jgi:hypothetical protein
VLQFRNTYNKCLKFTAIDHSVTYNFSSESASISLHSKYSKMLLKIRKHIHNGSVLKLQTIHTRLIFLFMRNCIAFLHYDSQTVDL